MCQWHFADRFWISSGVQWGGGRKRTRWIFRELTVESQDEQVQFKSAEGDVVTEDPLLLEQITQGQSGLYKLRMNYSYRMLSIPLGIGYRFSHQVIAPLIVGGLNCEIITNRQMSIDVRDGNTYRNIPLRFTQNTTKSNIQAFGALGLSFRMSEKIEFQMDAAYYRPLHYLLNANGYQVQSARILLNCGVNVKL
ncbi:MAG: hypothetical protein FJX95_09500 [Bacteroidetes bacterium]|nr:hypothetical protein [Bacteroidota bacterium]